MLDEIRTGLDADTSRPAPTGGPPRLILLHDIADGMTDSFFGPLSDLDDQIDAVHRADLRPAQQGPAAGACCGMQRWLVGVRKLVTPQRDVVAAVMSGVIDLPGRNAAASRTCATCTTT